MSMEKGKVKWKWSFKSKDESKNESESDDECEVITESEDNTGGTLKRKLNFHSNEEKENSNLNINSKEIVEADVVNDSQMDFSLASDTETKESVKKMKSPDGSSSPVNSSKEINSSKPSVKRNHDTKNITLKNSDKKRVKKLSSSKIPKLSNSKTPMRSAKSGSSLKSLSAKSENESLNKKRKRVSKSLTGQYQSLNQMFLNMGKKQKELKNENIGENDDDIIILDDEESSCKKVKSAKIESEKYLENNASKKKLGIKGNEQAVKKSETIKNVFSDSNKNIENKKIINSATGFSSMKESEVANKDIIKDKKDIQGQKVEDTVEPLCKSHVLDERASIPENLKTFKQQIVKFSPVPGTSGSVAETSCSATVQGTPTSTPNSKLKKLTPSQRLKQKEREEKRIEAERIKEEKRIEAEKIKEEKKQELERIKEEKLREKQELIESKNRLKEELKQQKEDEKRRKEEEKAKKKEEEKQEKLEKERLKQQAEEEEREKREKSKARFVQFFVAKKGTENCPVKPIETKNDECKFSVFQVKENMRIAPMTRKVLGPSQKAVLDSVFNLSLEKNDNKLTFQQKTDKNSTSKDENDKNLISVVKNDNNLHNLNDSNKIFRKTYLQILKNDKNYFTGKSVKTFPATDCPSEENSDDDFCEIIHDNELDPEVFMGEDQNVIMAPLSDLEEKENLKMKRRAKLLQFVENNRPAYYGTWSKKAKKISSRRPFEKEELFDYSYDSDDDWEDFENGESLSDSDNENDNENNDENQYEVDNEFFVPHGYLSDGEGEEDGSDCGEEKNEALGEEFHKEKLKRKQEEFELELKQKTKHLKPKVFGCVWLGDKSSHVAYDQLVNILSSYRAQILTSSDLPLDVDEKLPDLPEVDNNNSEDPVNNNNSESKVYMRRFPEEAMPDLIRLLHGNRRSNKFLSQEFCEYWNKKSKNNSENNEFNKELGETGEVFENEMHDKTNEVLGKLEENSDKNKILEKSGEIPEKLLEKPDKNSTETPSEPAVLSRTKTLNKIQDIGEYYKNTSDPETAGYKAWYVSNELLVKYSMQDLSPINTWKYVLSAKSSNKKGPSTPKSEKIGFQSTPLSSQSSECDTPKSSRDGSKSVETPKSSKKEKSSIAANKITKFTKILDSEEKRKLNRIQNDVVRASGGQKALRESSCSPKVPHGSPCTPPITPDALKKRILLTPCDKSTTLQNSIKSPKVSETPNVSSFKTPKTTTTPIAKSFSSASKAAKRSMLSTTPTSSASKATKRSMLSATPTSSAKHAKKRANPTPINKESKNPITTLFKAKESAKKSVEDDMECIVLD